MSQAEPILGISRFSAQLGSNQLGSAGLATLSRAVATLISTSQNGPADQPISDFTRTRVHVLPTHRISMLAGLHSTVVLRADSTTRRGSLRVPATIRRQ